MIRAGLDIFPPLLRDAVLTRHEVIVVMKRPFNRPRYRKPSENRKGKVVQ